MLVAIVDYTLTWLSFLYKNGCYVIDRILYHTHSGCMAFIDLSPRAFARVLSCNNYNILYIALEKILGNPALITTKLTLEFCL